MGIVHRNPTEESFIEWIKNHPEGYHPLDMKRFYTFAKNVNTYRAKRWYDKGYFRSQVLLQIPNFDEKLIDTFHDRLLICRDYHKSSKTQLIGGYGYRWYERKVVNHKIVDVPINDINEFFFGISRKR